ncbi:MAG: pyridoxamine 5'-phosphate oxidase [Thiothrix sp.]|nr:pyridoxamine 5'-phosphate oxidase [Thiothrix sp.]HPQ94674.1 pyridoxamine 5'-phosphate oxidase [Thiolinea sp.]
MDAGSIRTDYLKDGLERDGLEQDPFRQFERWFIQALDADVAEPNALQLATVAPDGRPGLRTVLLKSFDEQGFVFFTNYGSRKAKHMRQQSQVALLFFWKELERQVEIAGLATPVSREASESYFHSRPRGSQLGAWVSAQSSIIPSRTVLEERLEQLTGQYQDREIPLPDFWGGYCVQPERFEFWQGRHNRLHDRFEYRLQPGSDQWVINRLSP